MTNNVIDLTRRLPLGAGALAGTPQSESDPRNPEAMNRPLTVAERGAREVFRIAFNPEGVEPVDPWDLSLKVARAVIEAMREPTPKMLTDVPDADQIDWPNVDNDNARRIWAHMIDAALSEGDGR